MAWAEGPERLGYRLEKVTTIDQHPDEWQSWGWSDFYQVVPQADGSLQVVNRDNLKLWRVWVDECRAVLDRTFEEGHIYASGSVEARWKALPINGGLISCTSWR